MSKILRRPMFRGGPVSSYGNGIASGLGYNNGGRVGLEVGGDPEIEKNKEIILQQIVTELGPEASQEDIITEYNKRTGSTVGEYSFSETPIAKGIEGLAAYGPNSAIAAGLDMVNVPLNTIGRLFGYNPGFSGAKQMDLLTNGRFSEYTGNDPETARFLGFATDAKTGATTSSKVAADDLAAQVEEINKKKLEASQQNIETSNGAGLGLEAPKSDKEVIQEYMDMFKESLGGDKEELKRAKYLELAKFGANLLAQPGGQTLGESIGKAGAPALESISALQATERAGDRQAKGLGFQAALKELEPGSLEKNAKALARLTGGTVSDAAKQLSTNASASNNKLNTIKVLMESITAEPGIQYAVSEIMYDNGISRKDVSKIKDPNKITGDEVVGRYYYFEKPGSKGEVMGRWDGEQFILPGESGFK